MSSSKNVFRKTGMSSPRPNTLKVQWRKNFVVSLVRKLQWRIQNFPEGVRQLPKVLLFFVENCMKMNELGPLGGHA